MPESTSLKKSILIYVVMGAFASILPGVILLIYDVWTNGPWPTSPLPVAETFLVQAIYFLVAGLFFFWVVFAPAMLIAALLMFILINTDKAYRIVSVSVSLAMALASVIAASAIVFVM